MLDFSEKMVFVIGAVRGINKETAVRFAKQGANVAVAGSA